MACPILQQPEGHSAKICIELYGTVQLVPPGTDSFVENKAAMTQKFHKNYLKFTALVIGSFGPVFFLGSMVPTSGAASWTLDFLSWPVDHQQGIDTPSTHFLSALTGGFLTGWGVCVWCLQHWVYDHAPNPVRKAVLAGLLAWFVTDSSGSALSGNPSNVLFNVLVLLLGVGPLWVAAKTDR